MSCIVKVRSWEQVQWRAETAAERTFHRQTAFCGWVLKPPLLLGRGVFSFHSQLQEPERKCVPLCMTGGVSSFTPHSCWFIPQTGLPLAVLSIPHQPEETSLSSFHSCTSFLLEASCSPFSIPTLSSLGRAETVPWQTDTNASSLVCLLSSTAPPLLSWASQAFAFSPDPEATTLLWPWLHVSHENWLPSSGCPSSPGNTMFLNTRKSNSH